jgi:hypothetical protein
MNVWRKPFGISMVHILAAGGGGGGGGGFTRASGVNGGGGGGGGAGGLVKLIIPAIMVPDCLYVYCGAGGLGGSGSGVAGSSGINTYIGFDNTSAVNSGGGFLSCAGATGGGAGTGAAGGAAGTSASAPTDIGIMSHGWGIHEFIAGGNGFNGAVGGFTAIGNGASIQSINTGGAGGGGNSGSSEFNGGGFSFGSLSINWTNNWNGGVGQTGTGGDGPAGPNWLGCAFNGFEDMSFMNTFPPVFWGGCGGGTCNNGTGGSGGRGGPSSGGGGGGSGQTGGKGGDGGNGFVIIVCI